MSYVIKLQQRGAKWEATVSLSFQESNSSAPKGTPVLAYTVKGAVFEGDSDLEAHAFAKKWAEEQEP